MKVALFECLIETGLSIRTLADEMISNRFEEGVQSGFDIERVTKAEVSGLFLNRRTKRIKIIKPDGTAENLTSESIEKVGFKLSKDRNLLMLFDPAYSAKEFIAKMATVSRFKISIEPFFKRVDVLSDSLKDRIDSGQIKKVFLKNVKFSKSVEGVLVAKGQLSNDALSGNVGKVKGMVARLELIWRSERLTEEATVTISENGRFNIQNCSSFSSAELIVSEVLRLPAIK